MKPETAVSIHSYRWEQQRRASVLHRITDPLTGDCELERRTAAHVETEAWGCMV